jgi:flagellar protein FlaG
MSAVNSFIQTQSPAIQHSIPITQKTSEHNDDQSSTSATASNTHTSSSGNNITADKNKNSSGSTTKTPEEMESLVRKLNESIGPLSQSIKFGVDQNDVFYVSVISAKTGDVISRYPAEQAEKMLDASQEQLGVMLDTKG